MIHGTSVDLRSLGGGTSIFWFNIKVISTCWTLINKTEFRGCCTGITNIITIKITIIMMMLLDTKLRLETLPLLLGQPPESPLLYCTVTPCPPFNNKVNSCLFFYFSVLFLMIFIFFIVCVFLFYWFFYLI